MLFICREALPLLLTIRLSEVCAKAVCCSRRPKDKGMAITGRLVTTATQSNEVATASEVIVLQPMKASQAV